jgi:hypothetical protein
LYFLPLLQGHFSLRPIFRSAWRVMNFFSWQVLQVQAGGCSVRQLDLTIFSLPDFPFLAEVVA